MSAMAVTRSDCGLWGLYVFLHRRSAAEWGACLGLLSAGVWAVRCSGSCHNPVAPVSQMLFLLDLR